MATIPNHHIKQSICATRPPYREGRHPKAVKVYTVNNESRYILVQGVPTVGAHQELHKLCSSFGNVGEFNALDDYPSGDKYSEAYLVKYSKIQSARFAKRKLDDHSFFGGTLHVCYAPEYESVAETREKLQDRCRVIETKIRQFANNTRNQVPLPSNRTLQYTSHCVDKTENSNINHSFLQGDHNFPFHNEHYQLQTFSNYPVQASLGNTNSTELSESRLPAIVDRKDTVQSTFELLPPPKSELSHLCKRNSSNAYEFSRVRSSHATLPPGYDARLKLDTAIKSEYPEEISSQRTHLSHGDIPHNKNTELVLSSELPSQSTTLHNSNIIVRDYKPPRPCPRFVPRQIVKDKPKQSESGLQFKTYSDPLDQEIRKNAFHLGKTQGPAFVPQKKRVFSTTAQQSVNETIHEIRNKISKVITQSVKKQNDVSGKKL